MQIYIANRPTESPNDFIYTHQITKEFYIHQQVKYNTRVKNKTKTKAGLLDSVSTKTVIPVQYVVIVIFSSVLRSVLVLTSVLVFYLSIPCTRLRSDQDYFINGMQYLLSVNASEKQPCCLHQVQQVHESN